MQTDRSVTCRLTGGLGNQLFQFANAFAVARRTESDLILDNRDLWKSHGFRQDLIAHFGLSARVAEHDELPPSRGNQMRYLVWRYFSKNPKFIRERSLAFDERILTLGSNCYLHGYFQSERYFADFEKEISHEMQIITPPGGKNGALLERITAENAVSLHVRRGDYLTQDNQSIFAPCRDAYYDAAVAHVAERVGPVVIYMFSDDPEWVRGNLQFDCPTFISDQNQGALAYEDLRLMSACRHNIIANSSFSWWGAWLNPNPDKIVIAPEKWFVPEHPQNPDIIPEGWLKFPN